MTMIQRIKGILLGMIIIIAGVVFLLNPKESYPFITGILCLGMIIRGVRLLLFYIRMARFMVDGRSMLYQGIILLDLGLFTGSMTQVPLVYVMLYLIGINLFSGGVDVLRAMESRKYESPWKLTMLHGIVSVIMALACLVFIRHTSLAVMIYAVGVIYSGVMRIITACRKTTMVYIQ